jgi:hypothetical protein
MRTVQQGRYQGIEGGIQPNEVQTEIHETADYKRNASFAGSIIRLFLKDDTGDRRHSCFQTDYNAGNAVDKQQHRGQLIGMYKTAEYHFSQDEVRAVVQRNLSQYTIQAGRHLH